MVVLNQHNCVYIYIEFVYLSSISHTLLMELFDDVAKNMSNGRKVNGKNNP